MSQRLFLGVFEREEDLVGATRLVGEQELTIVDVYTLCAVHGLDEAMGLRPSVKLSSLRPSAEVPGKLTLGHDFAFHTNCENKCCDLSNRFAGRHDRGVIGMSQALRNA